MLSPKAVVASGGSQTTLAFLTLQINHSNFCPPHHTSSLSVSLYLFSSYKDSSHTGLRAHLNSVWPQLNLLGLKQPHFKIIFWDFKKDIHFGGHYSAQDNNYEMTGVHTEMLAARTRRHWTNFKLMFNRLVATDKNWKTELLEAGLWFNLL